MKSNDLVVNASPIISLSKIGQADLLQTLSGKLVVPRGVYEEIMAHDNISDLPSPISAFLISHFLVYFH